MDANIPWGEDTLFTLEFRDNHYALHTCNNLYLQREGRLQSGCSEDCLFAIEYHNGQLALRDRAGRYLSPIGSKVRLGWSWFGLGLGLGLVGGVWGGGMVWYGGWYGGRETGCWGLWCDSEVAGWVLLWGKFWMFYMNICF